MLMSAKKLIPPTKNLKLNTMALEAVSPGLRIKIIIRVSRMIPKMLLQRLKAINLRKLFRFKDHQ